MTSADGRVESKNRRKCYETDDHGRCIKCVSGYVLIGHQCYQQISCNNDNDTSISSKLMKHGCNGVANVCNSHAILPFISFNNGIPSITRLYNNFTINNSLSNCILGLDLLSSNFKATSNSIFEIFSES